MTLNSSNTLGSSIRGEYKAIWRNDYKHEKKYTQHCDTTNSKPTLIDNDIPLTKLRFFCATAAVASSFLCFFWNAKKKSYQESHSIKWLRLDDDCRWKWRYTWCEKVSIIWIVIFAHSVELASFCAVWGCLLIFYDDDKGIWEVYTDYMTIFMSNSAFLLANLANSYWLSQFIDIWRLKLHNRN